jgi:hypothetical protein
MQLVLDDKLVKRHGASVAIRAIWMLSPRRCASMCHAINKCGYSSFSGRLITILIMIIKRNAAEHECNRRYCSLVSGIMFNMCQRRGIQGSNTDFLICAVAEMYELSIFTIDQDFK